MRWVLALGFVGTDAEVPLPEHDDVNHLTFHSRAPFLYCVILDALAALYESFTPSLRPAKYTCSRGLTRAIEPLRDARCAPNESGTYFGCR
jgi:hypothetical protein